MRHYFSIRLPVYSRGLESSAEIQDHAGIPFYLALGHRRGIGFHRPVAQDRLGFLVDFEYDLRCRLNFVNQP